MNKIFLLSVLFLVVIPVSTEAQETLLANKPKSQAYARYLRNNGCLDSNGNRSYQGACKSLESEERYLRYYEHLRKVGCLDSNGNRLNNLFCLNTEPAN
jgi:hypothetical protein